MLSLSRSSLACARSAIAIARTAIIPTTTVISTHARTSDSSLTPPSRSFHVSNAITTARITSSSHVISSSRMPRRWMSSKYPEFIPLTMPALSPTMEKGNIASWKKNVGDQVKAADVLAEVETDKATVAFESVESGYLAKILVNAGAQDIPVGKLIAILVENQSDVAAFKDYQEGTASAPKSAPAAASASAPKAEAPAAAAAAPSQSSSQSQQPSSSSSPTATKASPLARKTAAEQGINLSQITGTGPEGRIIKADVVEFAAAAPKAQAQAPAAAKPAAAPVAAPATGDFVDIPHTNVRKVIAQRLSQSKSTIPHYYLSIDLNVDKLLKIRSELNAKLAEGQPKISVNDFIIKAAALALKKVPAANSSWLDNAIRQYNYVDISVAVSTDGGLITPVVKDADLKGLSSIAGEVKSLASKARANKLQPHEYQGGTFTISNLGMFGVKSFSAIINPPQACILAVGTTETRVLVNTDKATNATTPYTTAQIMNVTLSSDHRVVDGAVGAQYLAAFKSLIEEPINMLL